MFKYCLLCPPTHLFLLPFYPHQGISLIIPSFILIGSASGLTQLYLGLGLYSVSSAIVVPCLTTLASNHGPKEQKGSILGIFRSLGALARSLGPLVSSTVYWKFGPTPCYFVGALLMIIPLLQVIQMRKGQQAIYIHEPKKNEWIKKILSWRNILPNIFFLYKMIVILSWIL